MGPSRRARGKAPRTSPASFLLLVAVVVYVGYSAVRLRRAVTSPAPALPSGAPALPTGNGGPHK